MSAARRLGAVASACCVVLGPLACGRSAEDRTIAHVGNVAITRKALNDWMTALAPEHEVPDAPDYGDCIRRLRALMVGSSTRQALAKQCARQYRALRQRALGTLISSHWLIAEAAEKGLGPSPRQVRLAAAVSPLVSELEDGRGGDSVAQAVAPLQARAKFAQEAIRRMLFAREGPIGSVEVAQRYARELARYRVPERRDFEIYEHILGRSAAAAAMAKVAAGHRDLTVVHLHEWLVRPHGARTTWKPIDAAIFTASPRVLTGPVPLAGQYAFFEVTKITPAHFLPLRQVGHSIRRQLTRERRNGRLASFIASWRRKWASKTECSSGYIVQKCGNYRGPRKPEDPLSLQ